MCRLADSLYGLCTSLQTLEARHRATQARSDVANNESGDDSGSDSGTAAVPREKEESTESAGDAPCESLQAKRERFRAEALQLYTDAFAINAANSYAVNG